MGKYKMVSEATSDDKTSTQNAESPRILCDTLPMAVSTTDRGMANAALRKWDGLGVHLLSQRTIPRMMSDE